MEELKVYELPDDVFKMITEFQLDFKQTWQKRINLVLQELKMEYDQILYKEWRWPSSRSSYYTLIYSHGPPWFKRCTTIPHRRWTKKEELVDIMMEDGHEKISEMVLHAPPPNRFLSWLRKKIALG